MPYLQEPSDGRLWYREAGQGRPLLLVHGWCMSGDVWQFQHQELQKRCRVIALDLRGHGRSTVPDSGMAGFTGYANDLQRLIEQLDLQELVVVGWSLGAQVALKTATNLAGRLKGLVLVGATPRFTAAPHFPFGLPAREAEGMRLKVSRSLERALAGFHRQLFAPGELDDPQLAARVAATLARIPAPSAAAALDGLEALMSAEMLEEARQLRVPALLVHGDQDVICLPSASAWLEQAMPDSRRLVYAGCGHAPFLSRPDQFNQDLWRFVEGLHGRY